MKGSCIFKSVLLALGGLVALQAYAQLKDSARPPGDLTLFGDPSCAYWVQVEPRAKEVWLNAILRPINMGYMRRERPLADKFAELTSLEPVVQFVDRYCQLRSENKAMEGALEFFKELTTAPTRALM
jgi:hypothetical protein